MPVLGICYGQQLMAHLLGGAVRKGDKGEYGLATLELNGGAADRPVRRPRRPAAGLDEPSRPGGPACPRDSPSRATPATCTVAAMAAPERAALRACSSIPRWSTPRAARSILANFLFDVCGCVKDWDPRNRIPLLEAGDPRSGRRPQRLLLRQRRRGFDGGLHAVPARARRRRACAASTSIPA